MSEPWLALAIAGIGGIGVGIGLVIGAFVARLLRKYIRDDERKGKDNDRIE